MRIAYVVLNIASAVAAFIAAFLWYRASVIVVPPAPSSAQSNWEGATITVTDNGVAQDPFATSAASSRRNAKAANAAAVAALLQGLAFLSSLALPI